MAEKGYRVYEMRNCHKGENCRLKGKLPCALRKQSSWVVVDNRNSLKALLRWCLSAHEGCVSLPQADEETR